MKHSNLSIAAEVQFGSGCSETIGRQVRRFGGTHAGFICDAVLQKLGIADQIVASLCKEDIAAEIYTDIEPEPSLNTARRAVEFLRQSSCDIVIGVGGGSVLDVTKVAAALVNNPGDVSQYLGKNLLTTPGLPVILLPTTSGTGSESTRNALFYVPEQKSKESVISDFILPKLVLIDPTLTLSVPPSVTAATGMDALCHAVESYTGLNATPFSDVFAKEGMRLIATNLRTACMDGQNLEAREGMALGSFYAGLAIQHAGTNGVHALAYPLQGLYRVTHGVANSLLLPYVMEFNLVSNLNRFAQVAQELGEETRGLSLRDMAERVALSTQQLSLDIGIPQHLNEVGVTSGDLDALVEGALKVERLLKNNPRNLKAQQITTIYQNAF